MNTFTNDQYNSWFKQLWDHFSPIIIITTYENVHLLNQARGKNQHVVQFTLKKLIKMTMSSMFC